MKPFALIAAVSTAMPLCDSTVSYELIFSEFAKKEAIEIVGLETAEEQISFFESIPTDSIISEMLTIAKTGGKDDAQELEAMIDAYTQQDLPTLYDAMLSSEMHGMDINTFLFERNRNWITKMQEYMSKNSVFFAVGAGHLWGEQGVIQLLKDAGYTLTPIN